MRFTRHIKTLVPFGYECLRPVTELAAKRILKMLLPGKTARGVRLGKLTCPDEKRGTIKWADWVRKNYAQPLVANAGIKQ